jgi:hypothetical protein
VQEYADRCRSLAQKNRITGRRPCDPKTTRASGKNTATYLYFRAAVRLIDEALKIAITVTQAEIPERRNEAFYIHESRKAGKEYQHTRGMPLSGSV